MKEHYPASNKSGVPIGYKLRVSFSKTSKFFSKVYFYISGEIFPSQKMRFFILKCTLLIEHIFSSKPSTLERELAFIFLRSFSYQTTDFFSKSSFYISREMNFKEIPPKNGSLAAIDEDIFFYALTFVLSQGFYMRGYCKHTLNF